MLPEIVDRRMIIFGFGLSQRGDDEGSRKRGEVERRPVRNWLFLASKEFNTFFRDFNFLSAAEPATEPSHDGPTLVRSPGLNKISYCFSINCIFSSGSNNIGNCLAKLP